jgi:hypothetical protein
MGCIHSKGGETDRCEGGLKGLSLRNQPKTARAAPYKLLMGLFVLKSVACLCGAYIERTVGVWCPAEAISSIIRRHSLIYEADWTKVCTCWQNQLIWRYRSRGTQTPAARPRLTHASYSPPHTHASQKTARRWLESRTVTLTDSMRLSDSLAARSISRRARRRRW